MNGAFPFGIPHRVRAHICCGALLVTTPTSGCCVCSPFMSSTRRCWRFRRVGKIDFAIGFRMQRYGFNLCGTQTHQIESVKFPAATPNDIPGYNHVVSVSGALAVLLMVLLSLVYSIYSGMYEPAESARCHVKPSVRSRGLEAKTWLARAGT